MSSEESQESLTYNEVNSWRCDALKLYSRQRCLKVSGSKQGLVARVFAASEIETQTYKPSLYIEGVCMNRSCKQNSCAAQANLLDGLESI